MKQLNINSIKYYNNLGGFYAVRVDGKFYQSEDIDKLYENLRSDGFRLDYTETDEYREEE